MAVAPQDAVLPAALELNQEDVAAFEVLAQQHGAAAAEVVVEANAEQEEEEEDDGMEGPPGDDEDAIGPCNLM